MHGSHFLLPLDDLLARELEGTMICSACLVTSLHPIVEVCLSLGASILFVFWSQRVSRCHGARCNGNIFCLLCTVQLLDKYGVMYSHQVVADEDHFSLVERLAEDDYCLTKVRIE